MYCYKKFLHGVVVFSTGDDTFPHPVTCTFSLMTIMPRKYLGTLRLQTLQISVTVALLLCCYGSGCNLEPLLYNSLPKLENRLHF
jgi:hypothetical protein